MTVNRRDLIAAAIVVMVLVLATAGAYSFLGAHSGTVSIFIKDAPTDWKYLNVTFSEVKIHQADAGNESGWQTLPIKNATMDLRSLTDVSALLASANVSVGKYTQIRIVVVSATGVMTNGTSVIFTVPSGELKTNHPFNVTAGQTKTLTLDIDLEHSIVHNSQGWTFKPVLGAVTET
jgi:hypothetical protein